MDPILAHLLFFLGLGALLACEEAGVFLLPGDISVVAAGCYAAQGGPFILVSWLAATAGMIAGSSALFFTVRRSRRSSRALPGTIRNLVQRHGALGVAAARLIPGLRNATVFAAAAGSLSPGRFFAGLIPAAALWSGLLLALGWFGGDAFLAVLGKLDGLPGLKLVSLGLVIGGAAFFVLRLRATSGEAREPT